MGIEEQIAYRFAWDSGHEFRGIPHQPLSNECGIGTPWTPDGTRRMPPETFRRSVGISRSNSGTIGKNAGTSKKIAGRALTEAGTRRRPAGKTRTMDGRSLTLAGTWRTRAGRSLTEAGRTRLSVGNVKTPANPHKNVIQAASLFRKVAQAYSL